MGWLQPTHLIILLISVAALSSACGYTWSAISRARRRRARRFFILGFASGWTMASILPRARRSWRQRAVADLRLRTRALAVGGHRNKRRRA